MEEQERDCNLTKADKSFELHHFDLMVQIVTFWDQYGRRLWDLILPDLNLRIYFLFIAVTFGITAS